MPASKAASVQARVCSSSTPPEKVSHEPSEISETSRSEEPSLRNRMPGRYGKIRQDGHDHLRAFPQSTGPTVQREHRRTMSTLENRPNTALVVVDAQNGVVEAAHDRDAVLANVGRLVERARSEQVPVVWLQHS